jgi:tetratricopeptide (TPR) repeat protein
MAELERRQGHPEQALSLASEELARRERAVGPGSPLLSEPLIAAGKAQLDLGRSAEALATLERAATIQTAHWDKSIDAELHFALGRALELTRRDLTRGRALIDQARKESPRVNPSLAREIEAWLARTPGGASATSVQQPAR